MNEAREKEIRACINDPDNYTGLSLIAARDLLEALDEARAELAKERAYSDIRAGVAHDEGWKMGRDAHAQLTWSSEPPRSPGAYWRRTSTVLGGLVEPLITVRMVSVVSSGRDLFVDVGGGELPISAYSGAEWAGPIPAPASPADEAGEGT